MTFASMANLINFQKEYYHFESPSNEIQKPKIKEKMSLCEYEKYPLKNHKI